MLHDLPKIINVKHGRRVGRGIGSKKGGHTAGRGTKGQKSRSGYSEPRSGFEGGQMPLSRRIPKLKGFKRGFLKDKFPTATIKLSRLVAIANNGGNVEKNLDEFVAGIANTHQYKRLKIVGDSAAKVVLKPEVITKLKPLITRFQSTSKVAGIFAD